MKQCRSCETEIVQPLFSLGPMPLVNRFITHDQIPKEELYELDLIYCNDCHLIQLGTTVPPTELYSNYQHLSSSSQMNLKHLDSVADYLKSHFASDGSKRLLEIGSNDGSLLQRVANIFSFAIGVDPAENLAEIANKGNINIIPKFFSHGLATKIKSQHGKFDTIVGLNVVPHTENFIDLLRGVEVLLTEGGHFVFEFAYVIDTIMGGDFDTIYHEHIYNFSLTSISYALKSVDLNIIDVMKIPTQGGSLRVIAQKKSAKSIPTEAVGKLLASEKSKGHTNIDNYLAIKQNIERFKHNLLSTLKEYRDQGKTIVALGAPARGVVVLNYCGIDTKLIDFAIDDTKLKQGKLVPGVHIPVYDWSALESIDDNEVFLLVSWNYKHEVLKKLRKYQSGGTLIEYFPELKVVSL